MILLAPVTAIPPVVTVIAVLLVRLLTVTAPAAEIVVLDVKPATITAPLKLLGAEPPTENPPAGTAKPFRT